MKKRNILLGSIVILFLLTLTGCGNKSAIDTKTFKDIGLKHGYTITDVKEQYSMYNNIKEATVIGSNDEWQIEFYVLNSSNDALGMFNTNKEIFESYKGAASIEGFKNIGNYNTYSLQSNGMYMHLCRIDNTLLYVNVPKQYEELVKNLINELGNCK